MESGIGKGLKIRNLIVKKLEMKKRLPKTRARDLIVGSKMLADMTAWRIGELKQKPDWSQLYTDGIITFMKFVPKTEKKAVWEEIIKMHKNDKKYFLLNK